MERINNALKQRDTVPHSEERNNNIETYGIIQHISNIARRFGFAVLTQLCIAGIVPPQGDANAKKAEKLVVTDSRGNITQIVNEDGKITIGDPIFVSDPMWEGVHGVFTENSYLATDEDSTKLSIRSNKTLEETGYIPGNYPAKPVNLGNGTFAFIESNNGAQIHIHLEDGTDQFLPLNVQNGLYVYSLSFSQGKLYAAVKDKTDSKYYLRVFRQGANGQYEEDVASKIELPEEPYVGMKVYNGKIIVAA